MTTKMKQQNQQKKPAAAPSVTTNQTQRNKCKQEKANIKKQKQ